MRLTFARMGDAAISTAQYYFGETLWFGRKFPVAKTPIAEFDGRLGWRSDRPENLTPSDRQVVTVFGDSWTYGLGVSERETFPNQLMQILPNYDARNFGVSGFGIDQMVLYAERLAPVIQPKWIVVAFIAADLHRSCFPFYFGKSKPSWSGYSGENEVAESVKSPEVIAISHGRKFQRLADIVISQILRSRLIQVGVAAAVEPSVRRCVVNLNAALLDRVDRRFPGRVIFVHLAQELPGEFLREVQRRSLNVVSIKDRVEGRVREGLVLDSSLEHPGPRYHRVFAEELAREIKRRDNFSGMDYARAR